MVVELRGHHLICLHFFRGEGYNKDFVENLRIIIEKAESEFVRVVNGADDVCKKCPYNVNGICNYSETSEEEVRELDELALNLLSIKVGNTVTWKEIREKIPKVIDTWREKACKSCGWKNVCLKNQIY